MWKHSQQLCEQLDKWSFASAAVRQTRSTAGEHLEGGLLECSSNWFWQTKLTERLSENSDQRVRLKSDCYHKVTTHVLEQMSKRPILVLIM